VGRWSALSSFAALRHRGFAALWAAAGVSNIGTWMANVAIGVHVTQKTGQASSTGAVVAMGFLPLLLLSPLAGTLADRFERRRYLAFLNAGQLAVAATMAALAFSHALSVPWMAGLAFASGCLGALGNPAFVALVVELVPGDDLHSALSLNSAQFNLGRVVGPALAAVLFAAAGAPWVFALNALSFAGVVWVLARLRPPAQGFQKATPMPVWAGMREGVAVALGDPGLRLVLGAVFAVGLLLAPFIGFIPVYALQELGRGPELASLLTSAQGLGAVGAVVVLGPLVKRLGVVRATVGALAIIGPLALLYWGAPGPATATAAIALLGGCYLAALTGLNTLGQLRAPRHVHARASSLHAAMLGGGYTLGLVVCGLLADRFGLREVLASAAFAFVLLVAAVRWRLGSAVAALKVGPPGNAAAG
jgi:MFS family permease